MTLEEIRNHNLMMMNSTSVNRTGDGIISDEIEDFWGDDDDDDDEKPNPDIIGWSDDIQRLTYEALNCATNHNFGAAWDKITEIIQIALKLEKFSGLTPKEAAWKYAIEAIKGLERAHDRRRGKIHESNST